MQIGPETRRKAIRRIALAVLGLLLLWAILWAAVPPVAKWQLQKIASDKLGRQVTVGKIDFRPWSLEVSLVDLAIASADGKDSQLFIKRIYIDAELQSLFRLAPVVDAISIEQPLVRFRHLGDGRYDFDDVIERLATSAPEPKKPDAETARFALYNLTVTDGGVDFQDTAVSRTHEVRELSLSVPFLSNLKSQRDVKVAPRLAFLLNGSRFDSGAQATPFADTRRADANLRLSGVDIAPYLGYLPASLPVRLQAAMLDVDVSVKFEQAGEAVLSLAGKVEASGVRVADRDGKPLLAFERLGAGLDDVRPLERIVRLGVVTLSKPEITATRDAAGRINLLALAEPASAGAAATPQLPAGKAAINESPGGQPIAQKEAAKPAGSDAAKEKAAWQFSMANLKVEGAQVSWQDQTTKPPAQMALMELSLDVNKVAWPLVEPLNFSGAGTVGKSALAFKGEGVESAATAEIQVTDFAFQQAAPYLAAQLQPTLTGSLSADVALQWAEQALVINARKLSLDTVALAEGKTLLAGVRRLEVEGARIDLARRTANVGRIALTQPRARIDRDAKGEWLAAKWVKSDGAATAPATQKAEAEWQFQLGEALVDGGALTLADMAGAQPVALEVSALRLRLRDFSPVAKKPSPIQLSARIGTPGNEAGRFDFNGTAHLAGLAAEGRIDAAGLPLHAVSPYLSDVLNIDLLRALAGFRGRVRYAQDAAGPRVRLSGDASLEDLRANTAGATGQATAAPSSATPASRDAGRASVAGALGIGQELLSWKTLALRGLEVDMAPGKPTRVDVRETALADFFAHVSISETGRINLQDIVKQKTAEPQPGATQAANPTASQAVSQPPANINFGPILLTGGRVLFADRFVRPNYSADLTELAGKLGAFSSVAIASAPQMADLELRGRAEGSATLEITGRLNPLAKPLALDIHGKVRDLQLPPLSPYSIKYAGHGIERGKLSMDVSYRVQPDGQLTASNKLVLNQLTFSDPVPGAPASLPVRLAVALLADRNGVIDLDLPVSGSLNDPQFSLGPVIFRVIVNIVVKAITAPFSLLAGALSGNSDEASAVEFAPGTTELAAESRARLDKVAQSLIDKPALKLTVVGAASLEVERGAWQRARLQQLLLTEKRRAATLAGANADTISEVSVAEYPALLKEVYRRADMKKPRNLVGMARDLPQPEMEALLLAELPATPDAIRQLAVQRAVVVRDYLAARKLPTDRLFLGAPNVAGPGAQNSAAGAPALSASATAGSSSSASTTSAAWKPRTELSLAAR